MNKTKDKKLLTKKQLKTLQNNFHLTETPAWIVRRTNLAGEVTIFITLNEKEADYYKEDYLNQVFFGIFVPDKYFTVRTTGTV